MDSASNPEPSTLLGLLILTLEVAVPLAFLVSLALLRIYLRAVKRSMAAPGAAGSTELIKVRPAHSGEPPGCPLEIAFHDSQLPALGFVVMSATWRSVAVLLTAGLASGLVMALSWLSAGGLGFDWLVTLVMTVFFAWPMVIALGLATTVSWRGLAMLVVGYALVLVGLAAPLFVGSDATIGQLLTVWLNSNATGTLLALAFLARPIRAVGPMVVVFMIAAVAGALFIAVFVGSHEQALYLAAWIGTVLKLGVVGSCVLLLLTGAVLMGIVGWLLLCWLGSLYRSRRISDQSIMIDAVWLMFSFLHSPTLGRLGATGAFTIGAFVTYKLVATAGFWLLRSGAEEDAQACKLLLLRVFSLGARSERLFEGFTKLWRHMGSVRMIAGPDLATSTVEPHEFLDFLAGRLQRRFITGPDTLEQRLDETEQRRDLDGRFRVADFFCHDDTWQMTFRRLEKESDAVLMDLRGFSPSNRGCVFEITELLEVVPLARIMLVVDRTTDEQFLTQVFNDGWAKVTEASPNRSDLAPRVRLYRFDDHSGRNVPALVAVMAAVRPAPRIYCSHCSDNNRGEYLHHVAARPASGGLA